MAVGSSLALLMTTALAGREETGLYAVGHRVTFIGILMLRSFTWSFDPFVSRLLDAKDTVGLRRLLRAVTKALLAVNLPVACLVVLLAEPVVALFGSDFGPAVTCMRILAVDSVIVSLAYLADHLVLFSGRSSLAMANNFGLVAVAFVLDLVLIPRMGAEGAAWASLASHTAFLVVCALQVALLVRLTFFGVAQLNIVLTAGAATAAGFGVQYFLLPGALGSVGSLIVAGTFAVVYAPLLLLVLTPGDRAMIRRALKVARRPDPGA